jgi:hypothetical protein
MLDESIHHRARAQRKESLRAGLRERGKTAVEVGEPCGCHGVMSLRQRRERRVEFRSQAELRYNAPQIDDLAADRQRGHDLRALQRLGRIRQCRYTSVHAAFPILSRPTGRIRRDAAQIAQRQCEQAAGPEGGESGGNRRNDIAPAADPTPIAKAEL